VKPKSQQFKNINEDTHKQCVQRKHNNDFRTHIQINFFNHA
jgi:hypothetical protein